MLILIVVVLVLNLVHRQVNTNKVIRSNDLVITKLDELRLTSRAKVSTISVQSGVKTEEQKLIRMGRATKTKLNVFGGDPSAPQHTSLGQSLEMEVSP